MARSNRQSVGSIVVVALVVLTAAALVAGPGLAQQTTDDGMTGTETMGNDTMTDDGMTTTEGAMMDDSNETMSGDGMGTDDGMMTDEGAMTEDAMGTEDDMMTEEGQMEEGSDGGAEETASGGQPGFGVLVGALALVAAAAFALYRRR